MQGIIKNGSMAVKIRAKRGKLLSGADFEELIRLGSVDDVAAYLQKTEGYGAFIDTDGTLHRDKLEECIYLSLISDYESFYLFSDRENKKFINLYFLRREIWIIKSLIYSLLNGDKLHAESLPKRHRSFDVDAALHCKTLSELGAVLKNTRYGGLITEGGSIFEIETALDKYYFDCMFKAAYSAKGDDRRAAMELIGKETDATNIMWILRAKEFYGMSPEKIRESVLPYRYKLQGDITERLINAESAEEAANLTRRTPYGELFKDGARSMAMSSYILKLNFSILEKHPYSSVCALAFLHIKRIEIQNITSVIECVRYGIAPEEIKKRLQCLSPLTPNLGGRAVRFFETS